MHVLKPALANLQQGTPPSDIVQSMHTLLSSLLPRAHAETRFLACVSTWLVTHVAKHGFATESHQLHRSLMVVSPCFQVHRILMAVSPCFVLLSSPAILEILFVGGASTSVETHAVKPVSATSRPPLATVGIASYLCDPHSGLPAGSAAVDEFPTGMVMHVLIQSAWYTQVDYTSAWC